MNLRPWQPTICRDVFGGGSASNTSTSTNKTDVTVNPTTNVAVPVVVNTQPIEDALLALAGVEKQSSDNQAKQLAATQAIQDSISTGNKIQILIGVGGLIAAAVFANPKVMRSITRAVKG